MTLVSKKGCHLCDKVNAILEDIAKPEPFDLKVEDITENQALHDRFWLTIPVLMIDGAPVFDARDMVAGSDYRARLEQLLHTRLSRSD